MRRRGRLVRMRTGRGCAARWRGARLAAAFGLRWNFTLSQKSHVDQAFRCGICKWQSPPATFGTKHRNHCPRCLWSKHLDEEPGDRRCACQGAMAPIAIEVRQDGEWALVHRCSECGVLRTNRIAGDDQERSLLALALRPLARPAFPLDDLREM